jgi:uncharacterized membrane protein
MPFTDTADPMRCTGGISALPGSGLPVKTCIDGPGVSPLTAAPTEDAVDVMNEQDALILVAAYDDVPTARRDFETLRSQVKRERFELREAVLVVKDEDGMPAVLDFSRHHGQAGAGWGAGIGALLGLFVPPFVASIAFGAAAGALVAKFADHSLKSGLRREVGQALAAGTAVVLAICKPASQTAVERALSGSRRKSTIPFADSTIARIEKEVDVVMVKDDARRPKDDR